MIFKVKSGLRAVTLPLCFSILGCASSQPVQSTEESLARFHQTFGVEITQQFEKQVKVKRDSDVFAYLKNLAKKLANFVPELANTSPEVLILRDHDKVWRNYGLPGQRVYLSSGLIRHVNNDSELAAAIAIQFSHIIDKDALSRLASIHEFDPSKETGIGAEPYKFSNKTIRFFGADSIFAFSDQTEINAVKKAVSVLYAAGFDPRGVITLNQKYLEHPEHSSFHPSTVAHLIEEARRSIAVFTPLRNPVVRTKDFLFIQRRMKQL